MKSILFMIACGVLLLMWPMSYETQAQLTTPTATDLVMPTLSATTTPNITLEPTQTPWIITATPGPTQTPWIIEVTRIVVVTATSIPTATTTPEPEYKQYLPLVGLDCKEEWPGRC